MTNRENGKVEREKAIDNWTLISCSGANLNQVDIDSMKDKGFITDEVMQFVMQSIFEKMEKDMVNDLVVIFGPSVVHYIQKQEDKKDAFLSH